MWITRDQEALNAWLAEGSSESSVGNRLEDTMRYSKRNAVVRQQGICVVDNVTIGFLADRVVCFSSIKTMF
jgi:hypothetical protein